MRQGRAYYNKAQTKEHQQRERREGLAALESCLGRRGLHRGSAVINFANENIQLPDISYGYSISEV